MVQGGGRIAVEAARGQFDSTFHMLSVLVDVCPDEVWAGRFFGFEYPFWYQVYHVMYFFDFWLREKYDGGAWQSAAYDERIHPEFGAELPPDAFVSRETMHGYLGAIGEKAARFFDTLDDAALARPIVPGAEHYTYQDVIIGQIRHAMYNLGYLNGILRSMDLPESDWHSYNERD